MRNDDAAVRSGPDDLLTAVRDGILTITINRPHARNALTVPMYEQLQVLMRTPEADSSLRVIVLTGAGDKAFASGTDVSCLKQIRTAQDAIGYERRGAELVAAIESCRVPTIAAISGACVGGGLAIAAACDLRLATRQSSFGFPIARTMGNCLSLETHALMASLIGAASLKRLLLTAALWSADEALRGHLVDEVVDDPVALASRAEALARQLSGHAPLTLRATRQMIRWLRHPPAPGEEDALITAVYGSRDFAEGIAAFADKRKPVWQGR